MKERILYLLKTYLWTVAVFIAAKMVFMLFCREGHDFTMGDVSDVVVHGLTLDLSTALYFLIVPFLISIVSMWIRVPRWLTNGYFLLISVALSLAFVADTSLYPFWNFKLDASCLQYLETPTEAMASVTTGYILVRLVILVILVILVFLGYTRPKVRFLPTRHRLAGSVAALLCVPLIVIGIRGGIGDATTNIGQVYYSQNQFLNHSAVNPVFSFFYSLGHQFDDFSHYDFYDDATCTQLTASVFTTESIDSDTLLTTQRPHVVVILLEGAGEEFAHVMPYLQQLKGEGVSFSHCYANSWRTDRGTVSTLSGYPSFPTVSVMKVPEKSRLLPSIAGRLKDKGYATSYLYGGDANFTNMRSYLYSTGWDRLTDVKDFPPEAQHTGQWGVRDDITFKTLQKEMTACAVDDTPHLWGYSTLSSHEPWDVPVKKHDDEVLNSFAYLDDCLRDFVEGLRRTTLWSRLLIVITADHGINYKQIDNATPLQKNHIPLLWVGGAVKQPYTVSALCNQSDLAATLLHQLGLPHDDFPFSRDVLSHSYSYPVAVHNYNNAQWLIDSTGHVLYDFDSQHVVVSEGADTERLLRLSKAILQETAKDFKNR